MNQGTDLQYGERPDRPDQAAGCSAAYRGPTLPASIRRGNPGRHPAHLPEDIRCHRLHIRRPWLNSMLISPSHIQKKKWPFYVSTVSDFTAEFHALLLASGHPPAASTSEAGARPIDRRRWFTTDFTLEITSEKKPDTWQFTHSHTYTHTESHTRWRFLQPNFEIFRDLSSHKILFLCRCWFFGSFSVFPQVFP